MFIGRQFSSCPSRTSFHRAQMAHRAASTDKGSYCLPGTRYCVPSIRRLEIVPLQHRRPYHRPRLVEGGAVDGQEQGVVGGRGRGDGDEGERRKVEGRLWRGGQAVGVGFL